MNFQSRSYGAPASNFGSSQRTRVHLRSLRVGRAVYVAAENYSYRSFVRKQVASEFSEDPQSQASRARRRYTTLSRTTDAYVIRWTCKPPLRAEPLRMLAGRAADC